MKKIKVLHVVGALNLGGAETMIMNIFRNIDREKFQFDFFLSGNDNGYYEEEVIKLGGKITNIGRRKLHPFKYCYELFRILRLEKYDVVQIHATDALDGLPALISKIAGVKKICLFSHSSNGKNYLIQSILSFLFMPCVTNKQACSDYAARWMFGNKAKECKIIPLPILCDECLYDLETRNKFDLKYNTKDKIIIGHVGRMVTPKNHLRLLDIFYTFKKVEINSALVLIGTGPLEEQIKIKAKELDIFDDIIFLGQVDKAHNYMSVFDVFLFPSLYEGFPTVLLEAQANGLPCAVSDCVTNTIKVTDLVDFISLESDNEVWVKIIKEKRRNKDCFIYNNSVSKVYDAKHVANIYESIYKQ